MDDAPKRFVRDAAVATLVFAALYGLAMVAPLSALQIPGYLLLVFGPASSQPVVFGAYLVGLGVVTAAVAGVVRTWTHGTGRSAARSVSTEEPRRSERVRPFARDTASERTSGQDRALRRLGFVRERARTRVQQRVDV
jgi:protein-S-isoprenylcysteine O-methyltransferase Ste14